MANTKNVINMIRKLAEEAKAAKPLVRDTSKRLITEGHLAPSQKIVEKLPTAQEYSQKMAALKRAAGVGGAVAATSLISQEEAEAAGLTTIMKKLGVTKEVAQEIKTMAKTVPPDVFEQNIKAIQDVAKFKKAPESMPELGRGIDVVAHDAGENVVKVPRLGKAGKAWNSERMDIIPSVVEESGLGAKTKTIKTSGNKYQVQEKLSPLGDIERSHPKFMDDKILNDLRDRELELMFNNKGQRRNLTEKETEELFKVRKDFSNREAEIFKSLNIPEEVINKSLDLNSVDSEKVEDFLKRRFNQKVGSVVEPRDLHADNIGLDTKNQMKILDTGNFMQLDKSKMTPNMKKRAIQNYIALPAEKAKFAESLNTQPDIMKKAAAIAPIGAMANQESIPMGGELGENNQQPVPTTPEPSMLDRAKDFGKGLLVKGIEAYDSLSPDTKVNISAALDVLSQPGAALRGATYAAQTGQPILEGTKKAWNNPEEAPTGEQIAEATNLDDSNVLGKTAIATAAEFADPLDWIGLGAVSKTAEAAKLAKLKALGKLK